MTSLRALIVDDEEPARERLRRLLGEGRDVEIVGEAADGEQAIEQVAQLTPDVVFLDIQMPGCTGLEVAASLPSPRPHIIFCTAYDQYAVDAFELNAVDYLLKPVNRARLEKALQRLRKGHPGGNIDEAAARAGALPSRFLARKGSVYRVIPARAVYCFLSEEGLTKLHAADDDYWMSPTLNDLEARLDPRRFFRISRAAIVNLDMVRDVAPTAGGYGTLTLRDNTELDVSRRRFKELTDRLGGVA